MERFADKFALTEGRQGLSGPGDSVPALLAQFGGCTFVSDAFPGLRTRVSCFAFDWLGRQFATDSEGGAWSDHEVVMLEPGTGQALEIPVPFSRFHDEERVDYTEAALALSFFEL